jgi:hypothetical protein
LKVNSAIKGKFVNPEELSKALKEKVYIDLQDNLKV